MANEEQLRILKEENVKAWNNWRKNNLKIIPELGETNLSNLNLSGINLDGARLLGTNLSGCNLSGANFRKANLCGTHFVEANLRDSYLEDADLKMANFTKSNLSNAFLINCDFLVADLSEATLYQACLSNTKFVKCNFYKADLRKTYLYYSSLNESSLEKANLSEALLLGTQAIKTNFRRAKLTGVCIQDWNISNDTNLIDVECHYVYLKHIVERGDYDEIILPVERRPSDPNRNFEPGEFAKLVQKSIETVDLIFSNGIDWKAFLTSFEKLQIECGSDELSIHSFENKGDGAFVIRVNVPTGADKAEIEKYLKRIYQLEAQVEAKSEQLADLKEITKLLASKPFQNIIDITNSSKSKSMSDTFNTDNTGAKIANYANKLEGNARQQANQYNYASDQKQTLAEAAEEIQKLLQQLEKSNPTATEEEQIAYVNDETSTGFKKRTVSALKAGVETGIEEFLDNPYVNVGKAIVKAWIKPE